jgi:hypothetical protein
MVVEVIKSDKPALEAFFTDLDYRVFSIGINLLAVHTADPTLQHIKTTNNQLTLTL